MKRPAKVSMSDFYCTECGKRGLSCMRADSRKRKAGHLKKLWCPYCNKETNHVEVRADKSSAYTVADFYEEYNLGRFVDGVRVETKNLPFCDLLDCPCNKNGRCWNSNYSYNCSVRTEENKV